MTLDGFMVIANLLLVICGVECLCAGNMIYIRRKNGARLLRIFAVLRLLGWEVSD